VPERAELPVGQPCPYPALWTDGANKRVADQQALSRMISTIDVRNGFRDDILPMALSNVGSASDGLRNAILALAACHLWGCEAALLYKVEAIRSLSSSLSTDSVSITETQLATAMMLCVYNVSPADDTSLPFPGLPGAFA
jgi:hypothetical protein